MTGVVDLSLAQVPKGALAVLASRSCQHGSVTLHGWLRSWCWAQAAYRGLDVAAGGTSRGRQGRAKE
eukprot:11166746-Lingulodinium_polyedra.AAC.1